MPAVAAWQAVRQADLLPGESTLQQLLERIGPDVAAADYAYDDGAGRWGHPAGGQGGESRGARGFCGELAPLDQQANRVDDLQVGNSHYLVHETLDVAEGVFAGEWRGQAVRDGVDLFQMCWHALHKASAHGVGPCWLDSYHAGSGVAEFDGCGDARDKTPASDGDHHHVDAGSLVEKLEPHRPLAGHHGQVIERMDHCEIPLSLQGQACVEQAAIGLDDFAAVTPGRLDLGLHGAG